MTLGGEEMTSATSFRTLVYNFYCLLRFNFTRLFLIISPDMLTSKYGSLWYLGSSAGISSCFSGVNEHTSKIDIKHVSLNQITLSRCTIISLNHNVTYSEFTLQFRVVASPKSFGIGLHILGQIFLKIFTQLTCEFGKCVLDLTAYGVPSVIPSWFVILPGFPSVERSSHLFGHILE